VDFVPVCASNEDVEAVLGLGAFFYQGHFEGEIDGWMGMAASCLG
jgi:hypothetical protein